MTHYDLPWGPGVAGTVFDPTDDTFGPIMAAIQAGEFETAQALLLWLTNPTLGAQVTAALNGDSNDAEHDALVAVAEAFGIK